MSKTITIRLNDEKYELFKKFADMDNRAISNFIETATLRYIEQLEYADEEEMAEINSDSDLQQSLKRGRTDVTKNIILTICSDFRWYTIRCFFNKPFPYDISSLGIVFIDLNTILNNKISKGKGTIVI